MLDMRKTFYGLSDFLLILTANSSVHLKTLRDAIEESVEKMNLFPLHREGEGSGHWTVLDYGGLIVHMMREETRKFYALERLWEKAKTISWEVSHTRKEKKVQGKSSGRRQYVKTGTKKNPRKPHS